MKRRTDCTETYRDDTALSKLWPPTLPLFVGRLMPIVGCCPWTMVNAWQILAMPRQELAGGGWIWRDGAGACAERSRSKDTGYWRHSHTL